MKYGLLFLLCPLFVNGQTLSESKQKAINHYLQFVNDLTAEVQAVGPSLVRYYSDMEQYRKNPSRPVSQYTCKLDAKSYYYDEALKSAPALGTSGATLSSKAEAVRAAYQKIDASCKAIEIYFRLKDYESDKFKKFEETVSLLEKQVKEYSDRVNDLQLEANKLLASLQPYNTSQPYHKADRLMRTQLAFEKELLDLWTFNIKEEIHTGWPDQEAQQHILADSKKIETLKHSGITLKYPSSSMYSSFIESIESLQEVKRSGVDGYTYEKQQSDKHSNDLYFDLINYYNNAAVSFYNNFINQAGADGFRGIYYLNFVPLFSVRTEPKNLKIEITPFTDKPVAVIKLTPSTTAISSATFTSLSNYVNFINEGMRQVDNSMNPMRNLNSSASHGVARMKSGNRVTIDHYYKDFELPITLYQQTIDQSKALPTAYQKPLTDQAETLYSILTEINQWNNLLLEDAATKQLTKDSLGHVYNVLKRYKELVEAYDQRKEKLYTDVRSVFESYKPVNAKSSWVISGKALQALVDEDHKELFKARKFSLGDSSIQANTVEIEKMVRDLISNEFTNLAGIEKLGRYNGNCPYSPYEDLAQYSKQFVEFLSKVYLRKSTSSYYKHPYNEVVHQYNQSLIYQYNKFAELSKTPLLPGVTQMQLFEIVTPEKPEPKKIIEPVSVSVVQEYSPEKEKEPSGITQSQKKEKKSKAVKNNPPVAAGVVHDTVRITDIIRIETVRQDTVYVSKTDTVYVGMPGENMMSMEGYATNNMVLLLDVSGSMNNPDKLPLLKKSVLLLLKMMRAEDEVSIVTYSGKAKVELQPTSFKQEEKIRKVIERLKSEGKTDGNAGIELAYEVADKNYIRGGNNRIILATDGEFPISKETFDLVKKFAVEDIFISVFNFGKTTLSAKNLQQLSSLGRGNYEYVTRENVDLKLITEAKAKKKK